jgi:Xaa-Pro aminopeptidase
MEIAACRARQKRLLEVMHQRDLDLVIVTQAEHVQYLIGPRFPWTFASCAALTAGGHAILVGPEHRIPDVNAADEVHTFEARWHSTLRNDQRQAATQVLQRALATHVTESRLGVEFSVFTRHFDWSAELVDIEADLFRLRRRKDALELERLTRAIEATERMYLRARELIQPGVNELDVYNELQSVAVRELGEPLTGTGNDYQCASRGGPPRNRRAAAGELYILDLGPAYRGYFADNARTIAVTDPSELQYSAWQRVVDVFQLIEEEVRPGVSARTLFERVQQQLDQSPEGVFNHHLGHGIGLFPHEAPHLNPHWDDCFETGDVFAAEPGLYAAELRAGLRLENDYRVTENGVERLTNFPLELKL